MRNFLYNILGVIGMIGALFMLLAATQLVTLIFETLLIWN